MLQIYQILVQIIGFVGELIKHNCASHDVRAASHLDNLFTANGVTFRVTAMQAREFGFRNHKI